jgi:hypothetical protein
MSDFGRTSTAAAASDFGQSLKTKAMFLTAMTSGDSTMEEGTEKVATHRLILFLRLLFQKILMCLLVGNAAGYFFFVCLFAVVIFLIDQQTYFLTIFF